MRPEDFSHDESPGDVTNVNGVFAFSPDPLPPDVEPTHELVEANGEATYAIGQLTHFDELLDSSEVVLSPLIHREAADSSNIETVSRVTLSDIYRNEAGESPGGTPDEQADINEAQNYVDAIKHGIRQIEEGRKVDLDLLSELHAILLSGVRGRQKNPGELRNELVGIDERGTPLSEARFVPSPPATLPYELRGVLRYVQSGPEYAPLVDLALIHYQFETIHPFQDGNGRLGRLLIMLLLYEWELLPGPYLYPSAYFNRYREDYLRRLLAVSRDGEWERWIEFFLNAITEQAYEANDAARSLLELRTEYRDDYRDEGPTVRELIDLLFEMPYFTESQAVEALDRSQPAVNGAVRTLWDEGVIRERTGQQRNRRYEAHKILDIIEPY